MSNCSNNKQGEEVFRRVYPLKETRIVTDLSPFVAELELIDMSSDSVYLSGIIKMLATSEKYFFLSGGVVFSRSKNDKDIKRIGRIGRGPGEYLIIKDIALNFEKTELWCLDVYNSILRYDINEGFFLGSIKTGKDIAHAEGIVPMADSRFGVYVPNPLMKDMADDNLSFYCLRIFDYNGKERGREIPWKDYNIDAGFSSPVSFSDNDICILSPESSSCPSVLFEEGREKEQLFFDFGRKNVPFRYSFRAGDDPMLMLEDMFKEDYYKLISYVFLYDRGLYFRAYGENSSLWNFIIPKNNEKGIRWCSIGGVTPPVSAIAVENGALFFSYDDYGLVSSIEEEPDPLKKCVMETFGIPHSNKPCLIKVRFNV